MLAEERVFAGREGAVRLVLTATACREMLAETENASPRETGGVLVGVYDENVVVVRHASPPPGGSHSTRTSFMRGTGDLVAMLRTRWTLGEYYVGEWHAHPDAKATPSDTDLRSLRAIAEEGHLRCLTPVLVVLGGSRERRCLTAHILWSEGIESLIEMKGD